MKKTGWTLLLCGLAVGMGGIAPARAATNDVELHQTTAIINLLKSHYVDRDKLDQKLLNDATADGLVQALGRGVQILTSEQAESNALPVAESIPATREPLARVEVIEPDIGYIRLADISENTVLALDAELKKFSDARVVGYVLDLRFADGTNYPVAADVAGRFLASKQEVFTLKRSDGPSREFRAADAPQGVPAELSDAPLMVLINARTRGSAEALAGALQALDRAILVGGKTDGSAMAWDDIKLEDGRVLRVATAKIELPKGGQIFPGGLTPDIPVKIDPKVEQDAVLNSSTNLTLTASLRPREAAKALSEAALVKAFRGEPIDLRTPARTNGAAITNRSTTTPEPGATAPAAAEGVKPAGEEGPVSEVHDVVLQRAVDILKGIHVLMSSRGE